MGPTVVPLVIDSRRGVAGRGWRLLMPVMMRRVPLDRLMMMLMRVMRVDVHRMINVTRVAGLSIVVVHLQRGAREGEQRLAGDARRRGI